MQDNSSWNTGDEIEYVTNLGTGVYARHGDKPIRGYSKSRLELLKVYRESLSIRSDWEKNKINLELVLKHTDELIGTIQKENVKQ